MNLAQRAFDHARRVRPVGLGVHALVHEDVHRVPEDVVEGVLPLLVAHLHLARLQDELGDHLLVGAPERLEQVLLLGEDSLRDVVVNLGGLQDVVDVLLEAVPPRAHRVLVARDLEAHAVLLEANHRDVGQLLDAGGQRELRLHGTAAHGDRRIVRGRSARLVVTRPFATERSDSAAEKNACTAHVCFDGGSGRDTTESVRDDRHGRLGMRGVH